jgi:hypothetical protein
MVSATGDWTKDTLEVEYPAVRAIYDLFGAEDRVHAVRITAEHNYNKDSREAMYAWMARWLQHAPADVRRDERSFSPEGVSSLLVFFQQPLPANAVDVARLTDGWIAAAKRQLANPDGSPFNGALRHALGFASDSTGSARPSSSSERVQTVLLGAADPALERELTGAGLRVNVVSFTKFDEAAAGKVRHFETYNRTAASQRVADIVSALRAHPGAALVADGEAGLAGLLAAAIVPVPVAVLGVGQFNTSTDADYVKHVYIPGLRRAGDFQTAVAMARGEIVVHDASPEFDVRGVRAESSRLSAREIAARVSKAASTRTP